MSINNYCPRCAAKPGTLCHDASGYGATHRERKRETLQQALSRHGLEMRGERAGFRQIWPIGGDSYIAHCTFVDAWDLVCWLDAKEARQ